MDQVFGSAQLRFVWPVRHFGAALAHIADLLQYTTDHLGAQSFLR
jgi:hypothetical protein